MAEELRQDRSLPNFAQAIALYHMVVEATLAQPGQHFIEDYFAERGDDARASARGWRTSRATSSATSASASRCSRSCFAESDECKEAVAELLREVMPYSLAVFVAAGRDREYTRAYGFELEDIFAFGLRSVRTKWRATGYPMEEMPGVLPVDPELAARGDRARARSGCSRPASWASRTAAPSPRPRSRSCTST